MDIKTVMLVAIESCAMCMSLIIGGILLVQKKRDSIDRKIQWLVCLGAVLMLTDILTYALQGMPGKVTTVILLVSNALVYLTNYLILVVYGKVVWEFTRPRRQGEIFFYYLVQTVAVAAILLLIASQFTGWIYCIDGANIYHRGTLYPLAQMPPLIAGVCFFWLLVSNRRKMYFNEFIAACVYVFLPVLSTLFQIVVYGFPLQNLCIVVSSWILFCTREINVRNQLEQANQAKAAFLSRMSHDIRTPLNAIIGLLKIDQKHLEEPSLLRENHDKMLVSADHLLSLIDDVLQMSKLEDQNVALAHEPVDLLGLLDSVEAEVREHAASEGITVHTGTQQLPVQYVYGSASHLRQIFLNLYSNCIKYNKTGGEIRTRLEVLDQAQDKVVYRWTISDTGVGMSEKFIKEIYEPFVQEHTDARTDYQGTGLGMAIVRRIVEKMNGEIETISEQGVGTTFTVTIPFQPAPDPSRSAQLSETAAAATEGLRLLLVEDNELNAEIAKTLLEDEGCTVTVVYDGQQAVKLFGETEPGTFDAILMDVMMPVMDGYGATRAIRAMQRPDAAMIPIIALTANAFVEDAIACREAGMDAHVAKPFNVRVLLKTVLDLLERNI